MLLQRNGKAGPLEDLLRDWPGLLPEAGEKKPEARDAKLEEWQHLLTALEENQSDLPCLEIQRAQFESMLRQAKELLQVQAALTSLKQGATKQLTALLADCQRQATVVRLNLKQLYGPSADKLEDFGIQPARPRKRAKPAG